MRVVFDDFTLKREDGTPFKVDGHVFNLGRDIDSTRFTWTRLRDDLEHHAISSEVEIEVKKIELKNCKCEAMEVKSGDNLVFPHGFEGQDILLHIKVVEKSGMVSI